MTLASRRSQLTKPVKQLFKEFKAKHKSINVSMRTFHRHKPKQVMSVTRLKFRQCMCEVCINPKMKVARLNVFLTEKCKRTVERECV